MREIILDTETTGLDPLSGHRIVEIGCVEMVNRFSTGNTWHQYINPERDMPAEAFNVHGLSNEFLADKPLFKDLAEDFLNFIKGAKLVIHNASFDMNFLNFELKKCRRSIIPDEVVIDTLALARRRHPGSLNNLDALCKRYSIDNSSREKHGALLDSELLAEVYIELIGGKQADLELGAAATSNTSTSGLATGLPERPNPLPARLTEEEQKAHLEFINTLGPDPLWNRYSD